MLGIRCSSSAACSLKMPRNTRSSAAANKDPEGREESMQRASRGKKGSSTPARKVHPENSTSPRTPATQPQKPLAVPGSRMGRAKHSGLLAKDEEELANSAPNHGTSSLGLGPGFSPNSSDVDSSDLQGRDIYTIKRYSRRGGSSRGREGVLGISRLGKREGSEGQARGGATRRKRKENVLEDESSDEEEEEKDEMEGNVLTSEISPDSADPEPKPKRSQDEVLESDDEELSEESDDNGLSSIVASLNRGESVAHATEGMVEGYFTAHSGKTGPTSDHTLAKLSHPRMDQQSLQEALKTTPTASLQLQSECQSLLDEYKTLYPYWLFQMRNGFNILLYGLGSKQSLLEDFRQQHLSNACHLVVNGYFPGLTIKHVLNKLSSDVLGHSGTFKTYTEQAQFVCGKLQERQLSDEASQVFIVIHNIEGPMLRGEKAQSALSYLAQSPSVHFICSIDHINAPLIWDHNRLSRFNWIWHDVTTYETYREETSYENSLLVQRSGALALSSLTHVMKSLTPNARGIFELLARYQLETKSTELGEGGAAATSQYLGLSFQDCYMRCREKFLVNSDLTLRAQLTEFLDHKLIQSKKKSDGVEYLYIPVDDSTLAQFLDQLSEE